MKKDLIIALDGPAGAGKSSASRLLAERLGYRYVDTGALYRAVGLLVWEQGLDPEDATALGPVCEALDVRFEPGSGGQRLFVGQRDVTERIRRPEVSQMASRVSAQPLVRARLLTVQRELGCGGGVVVEGRDIGTVVFSRGRSQGLPGCLGRRTQPAAPSRIPPHGPPDFSGADAPRYAGTGRAGHGAQPCAAAPGRRCRHS